MVQTPTDETSALRRGQVTLSLAFRLGTRAFMVVSPFGAAQTPRLRRAAAGSAAMDVVLCGALARRPPSTRLRILLDSVDAAAWVAVHPKAAANYTAGILPSMAHTIELGYLGKSSAALGAAAGPLLAAVAVRQGQRRPLILASAIWPAAAVVGGAMAGWSQRVQESRRRAKEERWRSAAAAEARLAGQADMGLGPAAPLHDELQRAVLLMESPSVPAAAQLRQFIAANKQGHEARLDQGSITLPTALAEIAQRRRLAEPRLDRHVYFTLSRGAGEETVLLDASQFAALRRAIELSDIAGKVNVEVADRGENAKPVVLVVGGLTLHLTSPARYRRWSIDLLPAALLAQGLLHLATADPAAAAVQPWVAGGALLGAGAVAGLGHAAIRRGGAPVRPWVVLAGLLPATFVTVCGTLTMRHPFTDQGIARYTGGTVLAAWGLPLASQWPALSHTHKVFAALGGVMLLASSWAFAPAPRQLQALLGEVTWPAVGMVSAAALRMDLRDRSRSLLATLGDETAQMLDCSREMGRREELGAVASLLDLARYQAAKAHPAETDLVEVNRRLSQIERSLTDIRHDEAIGGEEDARGCG